LSFPLAGNPSLKKDSRRAGMTEKAEKFWTDPQRGEDNGQNDIFGTMTFSGKTIMSLWLTKEHENK
jgi:hypothetical protein